MNRIIRVTILLGLIPFLFVNLPLKPPHSDESVNGFFVNQIWTNGYFTYDPTNYHGPLLFYLFQISEKIFGFGVHSFRIVTALSVFLTVWFILRNQKVLGSYAHIFLALALGLSPGMIFFGRSAIHEPVFVFFQILWMVGFLIAREEMNEKGLPFFFAGILGCVLLKETFVISGVAFLAAWVWMEASPKMPGFINRKFDSPVPRESSHIRISFLLKTGFIFVFVWFFFYTGNFHHWKGVSDFFTAITPWVKTGTGGSGHDKPFYYWLHLFRRYEWLGVVGLIGAGVGVFSRSWKMRFFSSLALINGFIYSYIPYKTPWCVISILWPFIFVAGLWVEVVFVKIRPKNMFLFLSTLSLVFIVLAHSAVAAYRLNFRNYEDPSEPYVYVQTRNDFKVMEDIIKRRIYTNPAYNNMIVLVKLRDPWPFSWFFSRLPHVRFGDYRDTNKPSGDIIFSEITADDGDLAGLYMRRKIEVRDAREPVYVYLKVSTFEDMDVSGFAIVQERGTRGS